MVTQKNNFHEFETYNIFLWIFKAYVENTAEVQKHEMEHCMATGIERSGVKRIRLHDLRHSHARNRRVFLPTGIKRWTEPEKCGKICIRNDIMKSRFVCEKPVNKRMLICIACGNGSIEYRIELSKTRRQRLC